MGVRGMAPQAGRGGQQALYVTGVADNSVAASDILTVKNGVLRHVTQNTASAAADGGGGLLYVSS